jgi:hypothetical protein
VGRIIEKNVDPTCDLDNGDLVWNGIVLMNSLAIFPTFYDRALTFAMM